MADSSALPSPSASRRVPDARVVRSARPRRRASVRPSRVPRAGTRDADVRLRHAGGTLDRLSDAVDPQGYDLCVPHAGRTDPPRGWELSDRRPDEDRVASEPVGPALRDLGGEATVAVLAAALRAVPDPTPAPVEADTPEPAAPAAATPVAAAVEPQVEVPQVVDAAPAPVVLDAAPASPDRAQPRPRRVPAAGDRGPAGPATDW